VTDLRFDFEEGKEVFKGDYSLRKALGLNNQKRPAN
jgi:hypothetical protein